MDIQEIKTLQRSFDLIEPVGDIVMSVFYTRLFLLDPSLRSLFKADMKIQGEKMMSLLEQVVAGLDSQEKVVTLIKDLGRRHRDYGVRPQHFATFGEALIWALEKGLGDAFTEDVENAWKNLITLLCKWMMDVVEKPAEVNLKHV